MDNKILFEKFLELEQRVAENNSKILDTEVNVSDIEKTLEDLEKTELEKLYQLIKTVDCLLIRFDRINDRLKEVEKTAKEWIKSLIIKD